MTTIPTQNELILVGALWVKSYVVTEHKKNIQEVIINHKKKYLLTVPAKVKEINPEQIRKMSELDFNEVNECHISQDVKVFIKRTREGIHQVGRGNYDMPLPLCRFQVPKL